MLVAQILKTKGSDVVRVARHQTIRRAAELMTERNIGAVIVTEDDGAIAGILSERDIARGLSRFGGKVADAGIDALMTRDLIACAPTDQSDALMTLMTERRIRHLPVIEHGKLLGIISIGDIVKARLGELESQSEAMQTYIAGMA